jgi:hypothetical protein
MISLKKNVKSEILVKFGRIEKLGEFSNISKIWRILKFFENLEDLDFQKFGMIIIIIIITTCFYFGNPLMPK